MTPSKGQNTMTDALKEVAEIFAMTGLGTVEEVIDMAKVGQSLMERIDSLIKEPGHWHNWSPADDPAEIVFDMLNHYEDQIALARQNTALAVPVWQDIEGAPKDGTQVLLLIDGEAIQGRYQGPSDGSIYAGTACCYNWFAGQRSEPDDAVTHWMPLPAVPCSKRGG